MKNFRPISTDVVVITIATTSHRWRLDNRRNSVLSGGNKSCSEKQMGFTSNTYISPPKSLSSMTQLFGRKTIPLFARLRNLNERHGSNPAKRAFVLLALGTICSKSVLFSNSHNLG